LAAIVTANRLRDGAVVYRTAANGWSTHIAEARLAGAEEADALLAEAQAGPRPLPVVAPYLIEAALEGGAVQPLTLRERIRAAGPTV
jgi:sulfite reductase (NADPH) hemoprotein beta-component